MSEELGIRATFDNTEFRQGAREYDTILSRAEASTKRFAQRASEMGAKIGSALKVAGTVIQGFTMMALERGLEAGVRAARELFKEFIKGTEEEQALTDATTALKGALFAAFGPEILQAVSTLADLVNNVAAAMHNMAVQMEVNRVIADQIRASGDKHAQMLVGQGVNPAAAARSAGLPVNDAALLSDAEKTVNARQADFASRTDAASEAGKRFEGVLAGMTTASARYRAELERHTQAQAELNATYNDAVSRASGEMAASELRIQLNLVKTKQAINADYQAKTIAAAQQTAQRIAEVEQSNQRAIEAMQRQHAATMQYEQRSYDLSRVQNERQYQALRQRLVANGDVLAIDELDEQYALEQQAAEENFNLRKEQEEALFQIQLDYARQAAAEQVRALQEGLRMQMAELENQRQESIRVAEEKAAEERQIENQKQADLMATALAAFLEKQKAENTQHQENKAKIGEYLADVKAKYNLSFAEISVLAAATFGPDGVVIANMVSAANVAQSEAARFAAAWTAAIAAVQIATATMVGSGSYNASTGQYTTPAGRIIPTRRRARGGVDMVTQETAFIAGEGGENELAIFIPASQIRGSMGVSWQGGPIPVRGEGAMAGMNGAGVGNAMAQGLLMQMTKQLSSVRGSRGR